MRLLHCKTLEFEEFFHHNVPKYAIFSHTWDKGEVTFGDMDDRVKAAEKKGFTKIQDLCRLALDEGLEYAWIDACCIDKSSSAELSEAINSMFTWYKQATVCLVWLSDYQSDPSTTLSDLASFFDGRESSGKHEGLLFSDPPPLTGQEIDIREKIRRGLGTCRWFRRGWTLQELIAPSQVKFYDCNWTYFGSKVELAPIISWITGIDTAILKGASLEDVLVGRRMSWASNRTTTRVEDIAYCLLGIFDIHMPLLYGEGKKAFTRLQEEIIRSSNDLSVFAWTADAWDTRPFRSLWASSPEQFKICHSLVKPSFEWNSGGEYGVTSRGMRTRDLVRIGRHEEVDVGRYYLPLNCVDSRQNRKIFCVPLQQYGPSLFVRRQPGLIRGIFDESVYTAPKLSMPQYICCKETKNLESTVLNSRVNAVKIEFDHTVFDIDSISTSPPTDWDVRNSILLSAGRQYFWGSWKIRYKDGDDGIGIVVVRNYDFLTYGIFCWRDFPPSLDAAASSTTRINHTNSNISSTSSHTDDLLPQDVEEILERVKNPTSAICSSYSHSIIIVAPAPTSVVATWSEVASSSLAYAENNNDYGDDDVEMRGTVLRVQSQRVSDRYPFISAQKRTKKERHSVVAALVGAKSVRRGLSLLRGSKSKSNLAEK